MWGRWIRIESWNQCSLKPGSPYWFISHDTIQTKVVTQDSNDVYTLVSPYGLMTPGLQPSFIAFCTKVGETSWRRDKILKSHWSFAWVWTAWQSNHLMFKVKVTWCSVTGLHVHKHRKTNKQTKQTNKQKRLFCELISRCSPDIQVSTSLYVMDLPF